MSEARTFHCPTCGAPLNAPHPDVPHAGASTVCPYCRNTVFLLEPLAGSEARHVDAYAQPAVFGSTSSLDLSELALNVEKG